MLKSLCGFLILISVPWMVQTSSASTAGTVELDELSFDKILKKFKYALVKFDVAFPYGEKHEAFTVLGKDARDFDDLLIAQVGVKDYGEKDNEELAKKYGATKENFPVVKLFINGKKEPISFDDATFLTDNLRRFIQKHTGLHVSLPGCVRKLDEFAKKFLEMPNQDRAELLKSLDKIDLNEKDAASGKVYKIIMTKIIEKGEDFINSENERVKNLLEGKLSEAKKKDLGVRLNILQTFQFLLKEKLENTKSEL